MNPPFPTARLAADKIHPHLVRHAAVMHPGRNKALASLPDTVAIEAMVGAAFWASLRREEGRTPRLSLAFVSPDQVRYAVNLERPITLDPQPLTRVAPAVERPGIHLAVWPDQGQLLV